MHRFPPEMISVMEAALDAAVAALPEPVHSSHVQALAEAILRGAHSGERDPAVLQRLALLELQLTHALIVERSADVRPGCRLILPPRGSIQFP